MAYASQNWTKDLLGQTLKKAKDEGLLGGGGSSGGSTPIGTIIPFMGNTCPKGYLVCDGTVYNISNFQKLSDFFLKEFGSTNFFGGDGVTTFAVPDLRGEFLRGAGTNSHENQGNGADVGTHQDATEHNKTYTSYQNKLFQTYSNSSIGYPNDFSNIDSRTEIDSNGYKLDITGTSASNASVGRAGTFYTSRPTNTSVLYIIKYTTEEDDASIWLGYEDYSEDEKVIGQWTDGRPIYRKVLKVKTPSNANTRLQYENCVPNIKVGINIWGYFKYGSNDYYNIPLSYPRASNVLYSIQFEPAKNGMSIFMVDTDSNVLNKDAIVILEYTKTTDAENSFSPSLINPKIKIDGINQITDFSNYSTDEQVVGCWTDGKPIYRKVIPFTTPISDTHSIIANVASLSIKNLISIVGNCNNGSGGLRYYPAYYSSSDFCTLWINGGSLYISFYESSYMGGKQAYAILEYTKTTDAENSFNYSMLSSASTIDEVTDSEVEEVFA